MAELPEVPDYGMTSQMLADYVADFAHRVSTRILTAGKEQYDHGDHQEFEVRTLDEMIEGTLEELEDAVNHTIMTWILLRRQQHQWKVDGVKL